jgi:hypothetical protein
LATTAAALMAALIDFTNFGMVHARAAPHTDARDGGRPGGAGENLGVVHSAPCR